MTEQLLFNGNYEYHYIERLGVHVPLRSPTYTRQARPVLPVPIHYQHKQRWIAWSTSHLEGSHFFLAQESTCFSCPTLFYWDPILIDLPRNPQADGSHYIPPRSISLPQRSPPPLPSPSSSTSKYTPLSSQPSLSQGSEVRSSFQQQGKHHPRAISTESSTAATGSPGGEMVEQ